MKILITGICGLRNKGVEALLRTVISGVERQIPAVHFTVPTYTPDYDRGVLGSMDNVQLLHDPFMKTCTWHQRGSNELSVQQRILRRLRHKLGIKHPVSIQSRDPKSLLPFGVPDMVIVSGGDLYSSDYGHVNLRHFLEPIHWAHAHDVPCVLLAQSVGIFKTIEDLQVVIMMISAGYLPNKFFVTCIPRRDVDSILKVV